MADMEPQSPNAYATLAERHARKHRPQWTADLERKGILKQTLQEIGEEAAKMHESLWKQGVDPRAADEIVMANLILLPDEDDEEEDGNESVIDRGE